MTSTYGRDKKLGQLLVERGWISGEQLIRAIQSQRMVGGRLGTCLLEMDVLDEDRLLDALSDQLRVPAAGVDQLRAIDDGVLQLVPAKVAARRRVVPFRASDDEVQIATLDVHDLGLLDELRFCTNRQVVPHIANEVRIFEALERHYGYELPSRLGYLLDRLNRARYLWDESAKILLGTEAGEVVWTRPEDVFENPTTPTPRPQDAIPLSEDSSSDPTHGIIQAPAARSQRSLASSTAKSPVAVVTAPARPIERAAPPDASSGWSLGHVEKALGTVSDRHGVAEVVLGFAGQDFSQAALFEVRHDQIRGWQLGGHAEPSADGRFKAFEANLGEPSAFANLGRGASHFLGPLPPMPVHRRLARAFGNDLPAACLMVPIRVRERLVAVLYGDRGPRGLDGMDPDVYQRLATKAAMALELCILRRKLNAV